MTHAELGRLCRYRGGVGSGGPGTVEISSRRNGRDEKKRRGRPTTANQVATTPRFRAGWTGMLSGVKRHEQTYESRVRAGRPVSKEGLAASPAALNPIPLTSALLSFLVKQPGGSGCRLAHGNRLHSKCSKCSVTERTCGRSLVGPRTRRAL